jgi:hypothetical protein
MVFEHQALMWSDRCYNELLSLYPLEFRVRFRKEMCQVFRDCCRDEAEKGTLAALALLWVRTLVDLATSISRERGRAFVSPGDFSERTISERTKGLVESTVILAIIGFHLLIAGTGIAFYLPNAYSTAGGFFVFAASMGAALGGFAVLCSLLMARFRRIQYRFIQT